METQDQHERRRQIGRMGGLVTKARMLAADPFYYERIGRIAGAKTARRGPEFYAHLGRLSGEAKRRRKREAHANPV